LGFNEKKKKRRERKELGKLWNIAHVAWRVGSYSARIGEGGGERSPLCLSLEPTPWKNGKAEGCADLTSIEKKAGKRKKGQGGLGTYSGGCYSRHTSGKKNSEHGYRGEEQNY